MQATQFVNVTLPDELMPENVFAEPVDIARGLYRLANIAVFAQDASLGDVVRCEPDGWGRMIAVEVVERSDHATVAISVDDVCGTVGSDAETARLERLVEALDERFGGDIGVECSLGVVAVWIPDGRVDELIELVRELAREAGDPDPSPDDDEGVIGLFYYGFLAGPHLPVPARLEGAEQRLRQGPEEVLAVDWDAASCAVARRWPDRLAAHLLDRATRDRAWADALVERRYLGPLAVLARSETHGLWDWREVGSLAFTWSASYDDAAWQAARDGHGRVSYSAHPDANEFIRRFIADAGVDPDLPPSVPRHEPFVDLS